jgi:Fe-S-cluster-containing hydrogenase component 2
MRLRHRTMRKAGTDYICLEPGKCQACWECIEACPNGVIGRVNLPYHKHARLGVYPNLISPLFMGDLMG